MRPGQTRASSRPRGQLARPRSLTQPQERAVMQQLAQREYLALNSWVIPKAGDFIFLGYIYSSCLYNTEQLQKGRSLTVENKHCQQQCESGGCYHVRSSACDQKHTGTGHKQCNAASGKMSSSHSGEEPVAAGWGSIMVGKYQFEKLVFSWKTLLRKQGLALLGYWIWYLNLHGLAKYTYRALI